MDLDIKSTKAKKLKSSKHRRSRQLLLLQDILSLHPRIGLLARLHLEQSCQKFQREMAQICSIIGVQGTKIRINGSKLPSMYLAKLLQSHSRVGFFSTGSSTPMME